MKKYLLFAGIAVVLIAGGVTYTIYAKRLHPVIKNHGVVFEVPFATEYPDSTLDYKIVIDIGELNKHPEKIYEPFEFVSRMYNLHVLGGVKREKLDVVIAVWGEPISVFMNNEAYFKKYGVDNPNLEIISEMKAAGIKILGCGQSFTRFDIDKQEINPDVTVTLSRFTSVSTYQLKGYAYFKI